MANPADLSQQMQSALALARALTEAQIKAARDVALASEVPATSQDPAFIAAMVVAMAQNYSTVWKELEG